jgi:hypothetical protein
VYSLSDKSCSDSFPCFGLTGGNALEGPVPLNAVERPVRDNPADSLSDKLEPGCLVVRRAAQEGHGRMAACGGDVWFDICGVEGDACRAGIAGLPDEGADSAWQ